jgi:hypothetical protein
LKKDMSIGKVIDRCGRQDGDDGIDVDVETGVE